MFKSNKARLKLVMAGLLVFLLLCWKLAFVKTYDLIMEVSAMEDRLKNYQASGNKPGGQGSESVSMRDHSRSQRDLLEYVSRGCAELDLAIEEFPARMTSAREKILIHTQSFMLEGGFIPAINLAWKLETDFNARVVSLQFRRHQNRSSGHEYLMTTYYVQEYEVRSEK